jgi:hypothetical protein
MLFCAEVFSFEELFDSLHWINPKNKTTDKK